METTSSKMPTENQRRRVTGEVKDWVYENGEKYTVEIIELPLSECVTIQIKLTSPKQYVMLSNTEIAQVERILKMRHTFTGVKGQTIEVTFTTKEED